MNPLPVHAAAATDDLDRDLALTLAVITWHRSTTNVDRVVRDGFDVVENSEEEEECGVNKLQHMGSAGRR